MWPFKRKSKPPEIPVMRPNPSRVPDPGDLAEEAMSPTEKAAENLMENLTVAEETLIAATAQQMDLVKDLITETKTMDKRLSALSADLKGRSSSSVTSLDVYSGDVLAAYDRLKNTVGQSPDIIIRRFMIGRKTKIPAVLAFVDGLVDNQMVDQDTIMLMQEYAHAETLTKNLTTAHQIVHDSVIATGHATTENQWSELLVSLMGGNTIMFIQGCPEAMVLDTIKYPARSISTPETERSVKGPQEAFNEVILTQMNLVRRRIKSPQLHFDSITLGTVTQTTVIIAHIEGLTNPELVAAVKRRLASVVTDSIQYSQELVPILSDNPYSLFPQVRSTERVDLVVRELTLGKVAILVDNTPFALSVPNTLMDFYQTTEDYATNFWGATLERVIRFLGLFLGLLLPPLYIALVSVNPDLLPTKLAITIAGSRVGVPFPPVFEVLTMWAIIEVLREAAIRLPKALSSTLGTVGAIVVGTAIVKAGIVSPLMIVIITLTALGLFTSPVYEMAVPWRVLFWLLVVASYILGLYGIILGLLAIAAHLASLESLGVPYLAPFGPWISADLRDSILRFPSPTMKKRPTYLHTLIPRMKGNVSQGPMPNPNLRREQEERLHGED